MGHRDQIPKNNLNTVLTSSRRRCCLCVFLEGRSDIRKGQVAHLNGKRNDNRVENLVYLCFDHHDEFDSATSQAKGLTRAEVKFYRDQLYDEIPNLVPSAFNTDVKAIGATSAELEFQVDGDNGSSTSIVTIERAWRFPLWQVANRPELFAFTSRNKADGICLIERVNLPDGRIVIITTAIPGNPGISIVNGVEDLYTQLLNRFKIPAKRMVCLQTFLDEWCRINFTQLSSDGHFSNPSWEPMSSEVWEDLQLEPQKLIIKDGGYQSNVIKKFDWPNEAILE